MLEGMPDLQEPDMYRNIVKMIVVPTNPNVLAKLVTLNLGYNDLVCLPPELGKLKSLRILKVMNNFLAKVPMRVCEMHLKEIDVSSNPITEPPIETCERRIPSMRRYWRMKEQSNAVKHQKQVVERQPIVVQQQQMQSSTLSNHSGSIGGKYFFHFINPLK
jgi:Leucine-rich repeat (LRR) protein